MTSLYITKKMQGKMQGFKSLNTSPRDNPFCMIMCFGEEKDIICKYCYSQRALATYAKAARKPWRRNLYLLSEGLLESHQIPEIKEKVFRFHSHGELWNQNHYINFVNIARMNPDTYFTLYTKRPDLICGIERPPNMGLIYSEPKLNNYVEEVPEGFDRRFTVFTEPYIKEHNIQLRINCEGRKCIECLRCYTPNKEVTHINEKLKGPKRPVFLHH